MTFPASLLSWIDRHPGVQLAVVAAVILAALFQTVRPLGHGPSATERGHDWAWGWVIAAVLLAGRWPMLLLPREFNQDESLLLAGAHALAHDPVFWRSVEGGTVGPLPFFALWPAGWWCDWTGYFPARITAVALLTLSLLLAHQCLTILLDRRSARLAVLAALAFEALTLSLELVHYSTELVPLALLSAAGYAAVRRWSLGGGRGWNFLGGALLGALPFAKLQAVPLGLGFGGGWLLAEFLAGTRSSGRHRVYLLAGALLPALLFSSQITLAGEWENVLIPYFAYNVFYTEQGLPAGRLVAEILRLSRESDSLLHVWLPAVMAWIILLQFVRHGPAPAARLGGIALASCAVGLACTLYPGKPFLHYWQFMVLPLLFLLGVSLHRALHGADTARTRLVAVTATGFLALLLGTRARSPNPYLGNLAYFSAAPRTELSERVHRLARPGDTLAVWGWSSYVFVETGLHQITREACSVRSLEPSPYLEFYRLRYLRDFLRKQPDLFLDSVGPNSTRYLDPQAGHDHTFPALAGEIRANYMLVDEFNGARLYRRRAPGN
ncbi:hypothetical protein ESB00_17240 [Oleiharenicola lentus]|uniref:Glycosyltransferase RgtA/B/C/D-like domain-containing protein n=1 Tax=Oleiharenicola lentus TaxID=2508720 RepID=A0A4Q1C577_9BACT|nr:hypothetical protein [Oleiharenicola lentus]RXK53439.1 hypothetical protein ESB00_17240 [Oleiharenicola lentus]